MLSGITVEYSSLNMKCVISIVRLQGQTKKILYIMVHVKKLFAVKFIDDMLLQHYYSKNEHWGALQDIFLIDYGV